MVHKILKNQSFFYLSDGIISTGTVSTGDIANWPKNHQMK